MLTEACKMEPPIRLCCMQRHYGVVCPDRKVMCCLCFGRFSLDELNVLEDGFSKENVCIDCARHEQELVEKGYGNIYG